MRFIRKIGYVLTGFGYAFLAMSALALLVGFFIGLPFLAGIKYADSRKPEVLLIGLIPFVVCFTVWRIGLKVGWFKLRERAQPPKHLN